ncbi:MAG: TetR/AcrR family transcriptional regulator [Prevotellaceae bacterium]|jgi:AcrR family transcriptional regulator|nr:TetR/AcrR family transcriptional regulator [Prevotellaceae bacterium]
MRIKICNTASRLFLKYGIRAVSVEDICSELRISKKTFYQYFSSKEDLISFSLDTLEEKRVQFFSELVEGKDAILAQISLSREVRKNIDSAPELMLKDLEKYYPEIYKQKKANHDQSVMDFTRKNVEKGIQEGLYRQDLDADFIAVIYNAQVHSVFETLYNFDKKKFPKKRLMDFFFDLYFRMVVNEKGRAYYLENYQMS